MDNYETGIYTDNPDDTLRYMKTTVPVFDHWGYEKKQDDYVQVVRCKDCNNSDWYKSLDGKCLCYCMVHGIGGYTENDFCSRGERGEANEKT